MNPYTTPMNTCIVPSTSWTSSFSSSSSMDFVDNSQYINEKYSYIGQKVSSSTSSSSLSTACNVVVVAVPDKFICPLTLQIMMDPVTIIHTTTSATSTTMMLGHATCNNYVSFERDALLYYVNRYGTCPITSIPIHDPTNDIQRNTKLRQEIIEWMILNNSDSMNSTCTSSLGDTIINEEKLGCGTDVDMNNNSNMNTNDDDYDYDYDYDDECMSDHVSTLTTTEHTHTMLYNNSSLVCIVSDDEEEEEENDYHVNDYVNDDDYYDEVLLLIKRQRRRFK